ncbi:hypothetical protein [Kitasatospora purpeofusca]|uniref:Uncharacterized protein n=1 Tax=Kitasatospora purpeofusca TaxID=67352 RepID=A0ABZ1UBK8_9ACTN|nr:hypothetical protein [Kitasatospora purpeofusca]
MRDDPQVIGFDLDSWREVLVTERPVGAWRAMDAGRAGGSRTWAASPGPWVSPGRERRWGRPVGGSGSGRRTGSAAGAARRGHEMIRQTLETVDHPFVRVMMHQNTSSGVGDRYRMALVAGGLGDEQAWQYALSITVGAMGEAPPWSRDLSGHTDREIRRHQELLRTAEVFVISPAAHAAVMASAATLELADTATLDREVDLPALTGLLVLPEPIVHANRNGALSDTAAREQIRRAGSAAGGPRSPLAGGWTHRSSGRTERSGSVALHHRFSRPGARCWRSRAGRRPLARRRCSRSCTAGAASSGWGGAGAAPVVLGTLQPPAVGAVQ